MKEHVQRAVSLLRGCWKTLFLFEIIYRLFSTYLLFPVCRWLFNSCLKLTGLHYLSAENLGRFLTNPIMLVCCAVIFLAFSFAAMLEISCLITCLHAAHLHDTLGIFQVLWEGMCDAGRFLQPRNFPLLLLTAFMIPITQLPTDTSPMRLIHLPWKSLAAYAVKFPYILGSAAYLIGATLFFGLIMCVYHCYVLEDIPSARSISSALRISKKNRTHRLLELAGWMLLICASVFGASTLISLLVQRAAAWISPDLNIQYHIRSPFNVILNFAKSSLPAMACYAYISAIYYTSKRSLGEAIPGQALPYRKNARRFNAIIFYIVAALCILCLILYDTLLRPVLVRYDAVDLISGRPTLIIAHRGYSKETDENTISAFRAASGLGVDYVELDVQQTADGVVIVAHDNSFRRVFGDKRRVWETTYSEVRELTAPLSGECPPTLHEVLMLCDPQTNLLIELKNNGHNPGLPQAVFDILSEYQCLDRCIIQSSSYRMLREFKQLAPDVRCGYILSFALGNYATLDAADFFSIDYDFVNRSTVNAIHKLGKDIFVWTINDEKRMSELASLAVDGIITDDAPLAKTVLLASSISPLDELISEPLEEALNTAEETDPSEVEAP